ncbi:MAG: hypothetical protein JSS68_15155 [Actinobacteria bacterium]|nr:hypothetical protein [Actinomycetota bacterium]
MLLLSLIYLTVSSSSGGPELTAIAAVITAVAGFIGLIWTIFKGRNRRDEVEQAGSYIRGVEGLIRRQEEEIGELRRERKELQDDVSNLRSEVREAKTEATSIRGELSELRGQIRNFLSPEQYEEFKRRS